MSDDSSQHNSDLIIKLTNLSRVYQEGTLDRQVLRNINADIAPGQFSVLLGPSGSGKSTLLNLISGIDIPTTGEIIINGYNLTSMSEKHRTIFRRQHIGIVFQFFNLLPTLKVLENVVLPLELNGITGNSAKRQGLDLLDSVGLLERQNAFPDRLSGGEQQRVAIARALATNPPLLLADEPTGNLDSENAESIMQLLHNLHKTMNKTILVVTHRSDFLKLADRIFTIANGEMKEQPILDSQILDQFSEKPS